MSLPLSTAAARSLPGGLRSRALGLLAALVVANIGVWIWAVLTFRDFPLLLGTAVIAYTFGLRHAVDADHIAAIDNVTRKLMQEDQRPIGVGFFFSLGHSTVVVLASLLIAAMAMAFQKDIAAVHEVGGAIGTAVSAFFLLTIAAVNLVILISVWRTFQRVKSGGCYREQDMNALLAGGGFFARLLRPLFRLIGKSWHMYPLGFLFGLGFDTATEIGVLGISAAEASKGLPIWSILVFPALFTAGMSLIDTLDSILMVGAYGWAFAKLMRKLYYNLTITAVSVLVALVVGSLEALGLLATKLNLQGTFWSMIDRLNEDFESIGFLIIGLFLLSWLISAVIYKLKRYDEVEIEKIAEA